MKIKNQYLIYLSIILWSLAMNINAQTIQIDSINPITTFAINAKLIQADDLGNLYIVSPNNQLYKYNSLGTVLATLNYNYAGNISSIDASNPMEIYVFYKELNRVLFLDNNLAFRGELDLTKLGITQASAISRSYDNGIWVFDLGDLQLKKLNKEGALFQSSGNIKQFLNFDFIPTSLTDNTKQIMMANDSICLFFDVFASYIKSRKFSNNIGLQLSNQFVFETTQTQINAIDLKLGSSTPIFYIPSLAAPLKWSFVNKEYIYLNYNNTIGIFAKH